jgi:hypothetical protein
MAPQTGRTVNRWIRFVVEDSGNVMREIPINSINGVGLTAEEIDVTAFQDPVKTVLPGRSDCTIAITGPFDSTAAAANAASGAAPVLSGSHTVLKGIYGLNVPLALGILFGVRHYYETTEPAFGLTATASVGFICTEYMVNPTDCTYAATFKVYGTTAPSWIDIIPAVA